MQFLILSLAVWRLCALFLYDDLPFDIMAKFRDRIGIVYDVYGNKVATNQLAKLLSCVWCLSIWIALPFAIYFYADQFIVYWLALSGATIALDRLIKG